MKRQIFITAVVCAASAVTLGAQQPRATNGTGPNAWPRAAWARPGGGAVDDPAQFLLAHTGELELTDAQVTRLAAIARRSAERRRALRVQMDSMRPSAGQAPLGRTRPRERGCGSASSRCGRRWNVCAISRRPTVATPSPC